MYLTVEQRGAQICLFRATYITEEVGPFEVPAFFP